MRRSHRGDSLLPTSVGTARLRGIYWSAGRVKYASAGRRYSTRARESSEVGPLGSRSCHFLKRPNADTEAPPFRPLYALLDQHVRKARMCSHVFLGHMKLGEVLGLLFQEDP